MSSSKGRFPGRPSTKNGRHKIRKSSQSSTKSKEKTPTAISTVEENLHGGFLEDFSSDVRIFGFFKVITQNIFSPMNFKFDRQDKNDRSAVQQRKQNL